MSARLLRHYDIQVAHKPSTSIRTAISNHKRPLTTMEQNNVIYKIPCLNCPQFYVGQSGRKLSTRLHEHRLATRRHDQLSLVSIHQDTMGHQMDFDATTVLSHGKNCHVREFIEAWYSTTDAFNKHIDLEACYQPLRIKTLCLPKSRVVAQFKQRINPFSAQSSNVSQPSIDPIIPTVPIVLNIAQLN